jgi:ABC-type lipoprotein release transport system permease subunit
MFRSSSGEALVGRGVAGRYEGARLGSLLDFGRGTWKVVGLFESGGSSLESEVWVDVRELANDARRPVPYSGLRVRVADGVSLDAVAGRIAEDPRWALEAIPEREYYEKQAETANVLYVIVVGLAVLAGVGAAFGATNTLYAAVQARTAEIGTLRAIGFSQGAILVAFLFESLLLALIGSSWLGGIGFGAATFTTNVIELRVGLYDLATALGLALAIGLIGGLFPALRAARLRPVDALRKV